MKSNRKNYQGGAAEFSSRQQASEYAQTHKLAHYRIERRYAPHSPHCAADGYVCVLRVQDLPFGPINEQRDYLAAVPTAALRAEINRRTAREHPKPKSLAPCVGCHAPLSARERRQPCPHCGARNPR